jgi:ribonuclease HII
MGPQPSLRTEKRLLRSGRSVVAAVDEVGRGALSGPATVGVVLIDASVARPLAGVRDSKLLTPEARSALVPRIERWAVGSAVGHASAGEIDRFGLIAALRLAGLRALATLAVRPDVVLLDGNHDWLSPPDQPGLFAPPPVEVEVPDVVTVVKADLHCAGVAAASVLAKVARDTLMLGLATRHPDYGWDENKGYATPTHLAALRRLGPCAEHRRSWRLPDRLSPEPPPGRAGSGQRR